MNSWVMSNVIAFICLGALAFFSLTTSRVKQLGWRGACGLVVASASQLILLWRVGSIRASHALLSCLLGLATVLGYYAHDRVFAKADWREALKALPFVALIALTGLLVECMARVQSPDAAPSDVGTSSKIAGVFRSSGVALESWELTPNGCLSGAELGFDGVAFFLPRERGALALHVRTEHGGWSGIELLTSTSHKSIVRVRGDECAKLELTKEVTTIQLEGRMMEVIKGRVVLDCPGVGLSGAVSFDGCFPGADRQ